MKSTAEHIKKASELCTEIVTATMSMQQDIVHINFLIQEYLVFLDNELATYND